MVMSESCLTYRKYLDANGSVVSSDRMPQLMTSWGLLYSCSNGVFRLRTIIWAMSSTSMRGETAPPSPQILQGWHGNQS